MTTPLEVVGLLTVKSDGPGQPFLVDFQGDTILLILPDARSAARLLRQRTSRDRRAWIERAHAALLGADLKFRVRIGREVVGQLGVDAMPGRISRWIGVAPMEVNLPALLRTLRRRRTSEV